MKLLGTYIRLKSQTLNTEWSSWVRNIIGGLSSQVRIIGFELVMKEYTPTMFSKFESQNATVNKELGWLLLP